MFLGKITSTLFQPKNNPQHVKELITKCQTRLGALLNNHFKLVQQSDNVHWTLTLEYTETNNKWASNKKTISSMEEKIIKVLLYSYRALSGISSNESPINQLGTLIAILELATASLDEIFRLYEQYDLTSSVNEQTSEYKDPCLRCLLDFANQAKTLYIQMCKTPSDEVNESAINLAKEDPAQLDPMDVSPPSEDYHVILSQFYISLLLAEKYTVNSRIEVIPTEINLDSKDSYLKQLQDHFQQKWKRQLRKFMIEIAEYYDPHWLPMLMTPYLQVKFKGNILEVPAMSLTVNSTSYFIKKDTPSHIRDLFSLLNRYFNLLDTLDIQTTNPATLFETLKKEQETLITAFNERFSNKKINPAPGPARNLTEEDKKIFQLIMGGLKAHQLRVKERLYGISPFVFAETQSYHASPIYVDPLPHPTDQYPPASPPSSSDLSDLPLLNPYPQNPFI